MSTVEITSKNASKLFEQAKLHSRNGTVYAAPLNGPTQMTQNTWGETGGYQEGNERTHFMIMPNVEVGGMLKSPYLIDQESFNNTYFPVKGTLGLFKKKDVRAILIEGDKIIIHHVDSAVPTVHHGMVWLVMNSETDFYGVELDNFSNLYTPVD